MRRTALRFAAVAIVFGLALALSVTFGPIDPASRRIRTGTE